MTASEREQLLDGYAFNSLRREQLKRLLIEAVHDNDLREEMARLDALRRAFADDSVCGKFIEQLQKSGATAQLSLRDRAFKTSKWRWLMAGCAVAFAAVVLSIVLPGQGRLTPLRVALTDEAAGGLQPMSAEERSQAVSTTVLGDLLSLPVRSRPGVGFGFDRPGKDPVYRIGDVMRMAVSAPRMSVVAVINVRSDGAFLLYPQTSEKTDFLGQIAVPPDRNLSVTGPAEDRHVRLIVAPPGAALDKLKIGHVPEGVGVWDIPYRVANPQ